MQDLNATSIENQGANRPASSRLLPFLMLLFFGSGFAALIYEIVWLQLLELVIGSSGISLGVLLGTFMGGMCLGSLVLPRLISNRFHPLRVYAVLELGIGLIGILVVFGMPHMADLYARLYWHGVFARTFIAAVCLIPPTLLMGATLPAVARFVESTPEGVSWMGFFYGGNIAGAVAGCLIAGFFLLRIFDMPSATFIAAAVNALVAAIGLMLSRKSPYAPVSTNASEKARPASLRTLVLIAIALSGMSALGAEVVWTRLLSLLLGATVYSFSIILTVFLVGLGIGSGAGSLLSRTCTRPRLALGACQFLLAAAVAWAALIIAKSLPYWPVNPSIYTNDLRPLVHFPARPAPGRLDGVARRDFLGRQFSFGDRGRRLARPGPGTHGGRSLCGKHHRRHPGFTRVQSVDYPAVWNSVGGTAAGADRRACSPSGALIFRNDAL